MPDIKRYDIDELTCLESPSGDYVIYWDVLPLLEELSFTREMAMKALDEAKALKAENAALRTRVLEWVTVTEDGEVPIGIRCVVIQKSDETGTWRECCTVKDEDGFHSWYFPYGETSTIEDGDRYMRIPEAQP